MSFSVHFTPEVSDHFCASAAGVLVRKSILWMAIGFFVVVPWASAFFFGVMAFGYDMPLKTSNLVVLLVAPPVAVGAFTLLFWYQAKRTYGRAPTVRGPHSYVFGENGVEIAAPGVSSKVAWEALTARASSRFGELLLSGSYPMLFIPARAFSHEKERAEFKAVVDRYIGDAAVG